MRSAALSLLCVLLALEPGFAAVARVLPRPAAPAAPRTTAGPFRFQPSSGHTGSPGTAAPAVRPAFAPLGGLRLTPAPLAPAPSLSPAPSSPSAPARAAAPRALPTAPAVVRAAPRLAAPFSQGTKPPERVSGPPARAHARRLAREAGRVAEKFPRAGAESSAAGLAALWTGRPAAAGDAPVPSAPYAAALPRLAASGDSPRPEGASAPQEPAAPRGLRVFRDPERNRSFWRLFLGEQLHQFGFQMYMVALPYLMQAFTRNTLRESGRVLDPEALSALVRENRSLGRLAHWVSQAVSYVAIPIFEGNGTGGPRRWLVRSAFARALFLFGVPAVFFASGLLSAPAALYVLLGLIGLQSFFQGIYVTMNSVAASRIMGDPEVTDSERLRANAIRTFGAAVIAIIAPALAGKIATVRDFLGKTGVGSALIYGIYAATVGLAGLVFATIRILGERRDAAPGSSEAGAEPVRGVGGAVKLAFTSMIEGLKLVWRNRFLRTLLAINLVMSLFSDPLVFNVLPEYVEGVLKASPGAMDGLLGVPVLGWFLDGLVSTPMGFFALLITFSSLGSVLSTLLINPLRNLFKRLGFKTEEALTVPFYALAFLQVPAFWAMVYFPSFWSVLLLYGLQTFLGGFAGMIVSGIYQKKLGAYSRVQRNQALAANSFVSILAAIGATFLYGNLLSGIPLQTSLLIAAVATTVLGILQAAAPWLFFSKEERSGPWSLWLRPAAPKQEFPQDRQGHENLPGAPNGPLSVGL